MKRRNRNKAMFISLLATVMIASVFLTSKLWLPDDRRIMSTDKVVLQNRVFIKRYERYDEAMIELTLSAPRSVNQFEQQVPFLEKYNTIEAVVNHKRNKVPAVILYDALIETDELLIQVPYKDYLQQNESLYYVQITFDKGYSVMSDYRHLEAVAEIKPKGEVYSSCLQKQALYDVIQKQSFELHKATDETQKEAIKKAKQEHDKKSSELEGALKVCLSEYPESITI